METAQTLELLSSVFGYHNSNELTAAHKRGEIDPPRAIPVGEIALPGGETVVVVRASLANAPYAIDQTFLTQIVAEDRAEIFGPTPYGHLVDLSRLLNKNIDELAPTLKRAAAGEMTQVDVFCAIKTFRQGGEGVTAYFSEDELYADCAHLCRSDWARRTQMGGIPADFDVENASDREIVATYYQDNDDREIFTIHVVSLALPAALAPNASKGAVGIDPKATITLPLYQAEITHRHGTHVFQEASEEELDRTVALYCRQSWGEWLDFGEEDPDPVDPQTLSDEEVTRQYFAKMQSEYCERPTTELTIPIAALNLPELLRSAPVQKDAVRQKARNSDPKGDLPGQEPAFQRARIGRSPCRLQELPLRSRAARPDPCCSAPMAVHGQGSNSAGYPLDRRGRP